MHGTGRDGSKEIGNATSWSVSRGQCEGKFTLRTILMRRCQMERVLIRLTKGHPMTYRFKIAQRPDRVGGVGTSSC